MGRKATPTQKELWPVIRDEFGPKVAMIGGKGSAKTTTFAAGLIERCQKYPGSKYFISAASYQQAVDSAAREIVKIANMMNLNYVYRESMILDNLKHKFVYHFKDFHSSICIRSADTIDLIEGSEWDGGHIGEVQLWKEKDVATALARIRRGMGDHCRFIDGLPEDEEYWYWHFLERSGFIVRQISTRENEHNLPADYIDNLLAMYPGDLGRRYVEGEKVSLHRMPTVPAFDSRIHKDSRLAKKLTVYDPYRPLYISFDFNVAPCCVSLWQVKPVKFVAREDKTGLVHKTYISNVICQIDEFEGWRIGTEGVCELIMDKYGDHRGGGVTFGDASGNAEDTRSVGRTDWSIINKTLGKIYNMTIRKGLIINKTRSNRRRSDHRKALARYSNPPLKESIQNMNSVMTDPYGNPGVVFLPESRYESGGVARSVATTVYKADGSVDESKDRESGRQVARTHFWDTTRYAIWYLSPPQKETTDRKQHSKRNSWEPTNDRIFN